MKRTLIIATIGLLAHTLSAAESSPKDKVTTATKQLTEKSNYSWTTSTKEADGSQGRMGPIEGKAAKDGVKELLLRGARRRDGDEAPKIADAKGSIKFWMKDGALTKYESNVQGKVTAGDRDTDINRTITVEIKDAGTTKVEVPAEAKEK